MVPEDVRAEFETALDEESAAWLRAATQEFRRRHGIKATRKPGIGGELSATDQRGRLRNPAGSP